MRTISVIAIATLAAVAPVIAKPDPITVKGYPLNFETGAGARAPITLYQQQDALAFVVIDSIDGSKDARITVGRNTAPSVGAWLPLRRGERVTVQLGRETALKLKAHVMIVTGYLRA